MLEDAIPDDTDSDPMPDVIRIMPDYSPVYASDSEGCVFGVSGCFKDHPEIERIREIEQALYEVAFWIDGGDADNNPKFPWDKMDAEALRLARELAAVLGDTGIPVIYRHHYNNPNFERDSDIVIYDGSSRRSG